MSRNGCTTVSLLSTLFLWALCAATDDGFDFKPLNGKWVNHGGGSGLTNRRWAQFETKISTSTAKNLAKKWEFTSDGDVTATPSISADGIIYFPDRAGSLFAVSQYTGALVWKQNITALIAQVFGIVKSSALNSRATPVIVGQRLIVAISGPAAVLALNRTTGAVLWGTILDTHPHAIVTMSGTAFMGNFFIGTASFEELAFETCCSFQGAFFKLKVATGQIVWKTRMLPDNQGQSDQYAGASVWGSSPPIDILRREVYIATGNNYRVPEEVRQCEINYLNLTNPPIPDPCITPENHGESVLAINIDSGDIIWAKHLGGYDTWVLACVIPGITTPANCPNIVGPDYDFGMAPMLLTIPTHTSSYSFHEERIPPFPRGRDIVVVGQKSGLIWALDRDSGDIVWDTAGGPGGSLGGASWGLATDGQRVFASIINNQRLNFTLLPGSTVIKAGGFIALNSSTGEVIWSTANPTEGLAISPPTHANGVVFFASASAPASVYALDAKTGKVLKTIPTKGSASGGSSVADGCGFFPVGTSSITQLAAQILNFTVVRGNSVLALCVDYY